jgi:hypothetical protein
MADDIVNLPANEIYTAHSVATPLPDGQTQLVLTGVIAPVLKGEPDWMKRTLRAAIPLGRTFTATQWAPSVSLAAIDSDAATSNPGWAIDGFELVDAGAASDHVTLEVQTAVRDPSNFLLRMTYHITLVGS